MLRLHEGNGLHDYGSDYGQTKNVNLSAVRYWPFHDSQVSDDKIHLPPSFLLASSTKYYEQHNIYPRASSANLHLQESDIPCLWWQWASFPQPWWTSCSWTTWWQGSNWVKERKDRGTGILKSLFPFSSVLPFSCPSMSPELQWQSHLAVFIEYQCNKQTAGKFLLLGIDWNPTVWLSRLLLTVATRWRRLIHVNVTSHDFWDRSGSKEMMWPRIILADENEVWMS